MKQASLLAAVALLVGCDAAAVDPQEAGSSAGSFASLSSSGSSAVNPSSWDNSATIVRVSLHDIVGDAGPEFAYDETRVLEYDAFTLERIPMMALNQVNAGYWVAAVPHADVAAVFDSLATCCLEVVLDPTSMVMASSSVGGYNQRVDVDFSNGQTRGISYPANLIPINPGLQTINTLLDAQGRASLPDSAWNALKAVP